LDVRLGLGPENISPALLRKVVRHGGKDPFLEASEDLKEDLGLDISAKQVQRLTERIGSEFKNQRDQQVELYKQGKLPRLHARPPQVAVVMNDDGRVLTRAENQPPGVHEPQWKGPKYGLCLTLDSKQHASDPQPEPPSKYLDKQRVPKLVREVQSRAGKSDEASAVPAKKARSKKRLRKRNTRSLVRTVVASMCGAEEFGYILAAEAYSRSFDLAQRKAYVADGLPFNWKIWNDHFREQGFVPILDFLHLLTYIYGAAQAAGGGARRQWERYEKWLTWAWSGQREKLWAALQAESARVGVAPKDAAEHDPRVIVADAARYVENNVTRMDYPRYRKLGLPISSAPMESVVKQFNRRIKGREKFWLKSGAEDVLQVRAAYLSDDDRTERYWAAPRPHYRAVGRNHLNVAA
jgi:hypothetical protein